MPRRFQLQLLLAAATTLGSVSFAQTPAPAADPDANAPAASPAQNRGKKALPPPGVSIPDADRAELTAGVAELGKEIEALRKSLGTSALSLLLPDVEIYHKAVDWALRYNEFFNVKEVGAARELLKIGKARAADLKTGKAPWTTQTGGVVRGYRSAIDGSVQPYGVVVPATWKGTADNTKRATWIWNHGRGDTLTELSFINGRSRGGGDFTPADTFVVHPYGRYCNATKFAGEVDVMEALNAASLAYPVDSKRLVNSGFSMGGASGWHLGAHHPGKWAVSHAGAGFAETAEYAGVNSAGKTPPPWWESTLYRWYDATIVAANFGNQTMFAYHGSEDKQKQATEIMKRYAEKEGVEIKEYVGPGVAHKYDPNTRKEIEAAINAKLSAPTTPKKLRYVTYSLIYPGDWWVRVTGMEKSWERAEVNAEVEGARITLKTSNISGLTITTPFENGPAASTVIKELSVDGQTLPASWTKVGLTLVKTTGKWTNGPVTVSQKNSNTCGPIDHAFMSRFIFVQPSGAPLSPALGEWTKREFAHAVAQWRAIYRGDAIVKTDTTLTADDVAGSNLVLWGDPSSNAVLKRITDKLPVKWTAAGVEFGGKTYGAGHVPILVFPNPLNPNKYVVLNSGFTFNRAAASGTNSLQTPKLPDWAIVDTSVAPDDKFPGRVVDAGFFDEQWKVATAQPK